MSHFIFAVILNNTKILNEQRHGKSAFAVNLEENTYTIRIAKVGCEAEEHVITIVTEQTVELKVTDCAMPAPPPAPPPQTPSDPKPNTLPGAAAIDASSDATVDGAVTTDRIDARAIDAGPAPDAAAIDAGALDAGEPAKTPNDH